MTDIEQLRRAVAIALCGLAIIHAPLITLLATWFGVPVLSVTTLATIFAAAPGLLLILKRPIRLIGLALAFSLVGQTALLVFIFSGRAWQVEMHFYFFAVLAMLAGLCDGVVLLTAAGLIVVHHSVLNFLIPSALYPGGEDALRLLVHMSFVVIETGMLVFFARLIQSSLEQTSVAKMQAEAAAHGLSSVGKERQRQLVTSSERNLELEGSLKSLRREVSLSLMKLVDEARTLDATASGFSTTFQMTTSETFAVAAAADSASRRVEEVASAGRVYMMAMSTIGSNTIASAKMGGEVSREATAAKKTIDELSRMSTHIDDATKLIANIAKQTNMLALNATIEAARAGEHGRGFSVVAGEVKALSTQTAKAAATIAQMVEGIQDVADRAGAAMGAIVAAIEGLNGATSTIADAVVERAKVATNMSTNVDAAAADVHEVASAVKRIEAAVAANVERAGFLKLAAGEIATQTDLIHRHIDDFASDLAMFPTTRTADVISRHDDALSEASLSSAPSIGAMSAG